MAKGLRASTEKANRSELRSRVFGPIEKARKDRLSAKLLDLAAQPKTTLNIDSPMVVEENGKHDPPYQGLDEVGHFGGNFIKATKSPSRQGTTERDNIHGNEQVMDVDGGNVAESKSVAGRRGRIQKTRRGKSSAAMVFPVYKKGKLTGPKLNAKRRKQSLRPK